MLNKLFPLLLVIIALTAKAGAVNVDYVTVGDAGNAADPLTGFGAVDYAYYISKYEVTNAQYAEFLNAKATTDTYSLYGTGLYGVINRIRNGDTYVYTVTSGYENNALTDVTWFAAARFCNWLSNGQGVGSTETGSYTLNGATSGIFMANADAIIHIPTEDEWYKAAYYNGATQDYSLYANGQDTISTADANYASIVGHSTAVGSYASDVSYYGTFDQNGNASEWNDALIYNDTLRGTRGGRYNSNASILSSTYRGALPPTVDYAGIRLVSLVPEPSSLVLSMLAGMALISRRKR